LILLGQGRISVWSRKGFPFVLEKLKKSEVIEAYTITGLTLLDNEKPLVYDIINGASNGENFTDFFTQQCNGCLFKGDTVIGDNMNFHVEGWSCDVINEVLSDKGVKYYALPKYSPELNPIELVWAWLKQRLRKTPLSKDLLTATTDILNSLTTEQVLATYQDCGYL